MMKNKRLICILAAMCLLLLTACTSTPKDGEKTAATTKQQAVQDVPGNLTGDGEDKTDTPAVSAPANPSEEEPSSPLQKSPRDTAKGLYEMPSNIPALSPDGVQGKLKQVYYTTNGALAVTLNLSNGTALDQTVTDVTLRITNDQNVVLAEQVTVAIEACTVKAGGFAEVYFDVDKAQVLVDNDPLTALVGTFTFTAMSADNGSSTSPVLPNAIDPKAPAKGLTYYENTGWVPSSEAVEGALVSARYTNDGSMLVKLKLANNTDTACTVTAVELTVISDTSGAQITACTFEGLSLAVPAKNMIEYSALIDQTDVLMKYDALTAITAHTVLKTAQE